MELMRLNYVAYRRNIVVLKELRIYFDLFFPPLRHGFRKPGGEVFGRTGQESRCCASPMAGLMTRKQRMKGLEIAIGTAFKAGQCPINGKNLLTCRSEINKQCSPFGLEFGCLGRN